MIANAVRGRPPEPARKLQVWRPAGGAWNSQRSERAAARGGGPLELHPLAHGGHVGARAPRWASRAGAGRRRDGRRGSTGMPAVRGTGHVGSASLGGGRSPRRTLCAVTGVTGATRRAATGAALLASVTCASRRRGRYCPCVLRIGLTGGIGSGKSTVSRRSWPSAARVVVDADRIAREVVEPGTPGLAAVVEAFGDGVLTADGVLDRPALAAVVFADPEARAPARRRSCTRSCARGRPSCRRGARRTPSWSTTSRCWWRPARRRSYDLVLVVEADAGDPGRPARPARADRGGRPGPDRRPGHRRAAPRGGRRRPGQQRDAGGAGRAGGPVLGRAWSRPGGRLTASNEKSPRSVTWGSPGGRYWDRTSDLFRVREARYRCANRPSRPRDRTLLRARAPRRRRGGDGI